jgi:hypothetical protein
MNAALRLLGTLSVGSVLVQSIAGCASTPRRFPLRPPLWQDTDLRSFVAACRIEPSKKDPQHIACAPELYVSPLVWDGADNTVFRPLSRVFAVDPPNEAPNANSLDEVPDSAWFKNRIGVHPMTVEEVTRGACETAQHLDPTDVPDGTWVVDQGKPNGSTPGFRVNIPGKGKYMFKVDADVGGAIVSGEATSHAERATGASVIGAAAYNAVGFYTSCEQVIYIKPSVLKLTPGLRFTDNSGIEKSFDQKALDAVLKATTKRGDLLRIQASAWLPGHLIGPFRYTGTRPDDPNDAILHEDRRELRGARLLAAWLDHFDAREQNSMDSWIADRGKDAPDSSPGYVRHYYLDMSDCLGSEWIWDAITRRLGHSYFVDWGDMGLDFITLGIPLRTWDTVQRTKGREKFGYYNVQDFVPEDWKNEYSNPAFSRMTERDGAWMARILARLTPEMVAGLAKIGDFADPSDVTFLAGVMEGRLEKVLDRYLTRLSPITDVRVEGNDRLCAVDLAERRGVRPRGAFRYSAQLDRRPVQSLAVDRQADGALCITLPHVAADGGGRDDSVGRYVSVTIDDGVAKGPLVAYLYDLGSTRGYALAGLERPER